MWMQVLVNTPAGVRALALALIATGLEHRGQVHHPAAATSRTRTVRSNLRRCFAVSDTPGMTRGRVFTALGSAGAPQIQCSITLPGESGGGAPRARGNDFAAGIDSGKPYPGRSLQLKCTFASRAMIYTTLIVRSGFLGSSAKRTAGWFLGPVVFAGPQFDRLRFG
jgi:hypothetical protein